MDVKSGRLPLQPLDAPVLPPTHAPQTREGQMDPTPDRQLVTQLLQQWGSGNREAMDELMSVVYDQLRKLASNCLRAERPDHTLRATALVHEAYLRLVPR